MNEAMDILIAMGADTTQAPLLLCAVLLFALVLVVVVFIWLPNSGSLVRSHISRNANKQILMFVEMIPSGVRDIIVKPFFEIPHAGGTIDDPLVCESIDDAIVRLEAVGSGLLRYVKPENLLLIFSQSTKTLRDVLLAPISGDLLYDPRDNTAATRKGQPRCYRHAGREKKCTTEPRAIVLCHVGQSESFNCLWRSKQNDSNREGNYCEITWSQFKELRDSGGDDAFSHAMDSVSEANVVYPQLSVE